MSTGQGGICIEDVEGLAAYAGTSLSLLAGWKATSGQSLRSAHMITGQGGICMGDVAEFAAYNAHSGASRCRQIGGFIEGLSTLGSQPRGLLVWLRYYYVKTYCASRESQSRSRLYIDDTISRRTECTEQSAAYRPYCAPRSCPLGPHPSLEGTDPMR